MVYKYYINGEYKGEKTKAEETFEYTGLNSNTKYTIQIEIRNSTTDEYLGSIVKQIKTIDSGVAAGAEPSMLLLDISTGDCKQPLKLEEGEFLSRPETVHQPTHSPHLCSLPCTHSRAHG